MSAYTVVWEKSAENELVDLWLNANNRDHVTEATNEIDKTLAQDPYAIGSELREGLRVLHIIPLVVFFPISDADRLVKVHRVREG